VREHGKRAAGNRKEDRGCAAALFAPDARTTERIVEFFTAQIRNPNMRKA
jgi:hypothetical protein